MPRKKKNALPYDKAGGICSIQRRLLESNAYLSLSPQAKVLMTLLQVHWSNYKPVDYGVREAEQKISCSRKLAMRAFSELQERGFIAMVNESMWHVRVSQRTRTWRLTWLPFDSKPPTNDWEKINLMGVKTTPVEESRCRK